MKNKLHFLMLEDSSVRLLNNQNMEKLRNAIPDSWIEIMSVERKETRCQAVIELWRKYLGDKLPNVLSRFEEGLENVELLERYDKEGKKYSMLYSIIDEEGKCIYYEGGNPLDNISYRVQLNYWEKFPIRIRNFYEKMY